MQSARIAELLKPFVPGAELTPKLLEQLQIFLELLLRWNARMNLTAVRDPEQIVTRHFGESLFAAGLLKPHAPTTLADFGAGAGFPGIPIKLLLPGCELTLIESHSKKAVFLREVLRALTVEHAQVFYGRAEQWGGTADVVTLRAVEKFERALPIGAGLVAPRGELCLLIGAGQVEAARATLGNGWQWREPVPVPRGDARVVAIAERELGARD
jgi:16S rRNA (guanine527-N7)-methyltransferase